MKPVKTYMHPHSRVRRALEFINRARCASHIEVARHMSIGTSHASAICNYLFKTGRISRVQRGTPGIYGRGSVWHTLTNV